MIKTKYKDRWWLILDWRVPKERKIIYSYFDTDYFHAILAYHRRKYKLKDISKEKLFELIEAAENPKGEVKKYCKEHGKNLKDEVDDHLNEYYLNFIDITSEVRKEILKSLIDTP